MAKMKLAGVVLVIVLLLVGLSLMGLMGCGGGYTIRNGWLKVALTDNAADNFQNLVITIREVRVVPTGQQNAPTGPGLPLVANFEPPLSVDIMTLGFQQELLGEALIPSGTYEQVRLVLERNQQGQEPVNYITFKTDPSTKYPLTTPSGQESGLKVLGRFEVKPGVLNAIVLDFNPKKAIVEAGESGQYLIKPTGIGIVQVADVLDTYGSLSGTVMPETAWPTAVVAVVPQGSNTAIASGTVNPGDGTFRAFVPEGNYSIRVRANGFPPFDSAQSEPPQYFSVTVGEDTPVGTINLEQLPCMTSGRLLPMLNSFQKYHKNKG